jgi:hypothetical protein
MARLTVSEAPRFTHNCTACIFLGRFNGYRGLSDLYVHPSGKPFSRSTIARWGDESCEYSSGMSFAYGLIPDLTEARVRAEAGGLLEYDLFEALNYAVLGTPSHETMRKQLPFTLEYQAFLAYEKGNKERAEALVRHLFSLARQAHPESEVSDVLTHQLERRLRAVVTTYRCTTAISDPTNLLLNSMTEFLWEENASELEASWESFKTTA